MKVLHVEGAPGVGAAAQAELLAAGHLVVGCDAAEPSAPCRGLEAVGDCPLDLGDVDVSVVSRAGEQLTSAERGALCETRWMATMHPTSFPADGAPSERSVFNALSRLPDPWHVIHSRVNRKWLAIELARARQEATLTVCGPRDCHGCAPFARDCVKGIVARTTGRPIRSNTR